jgi:hypothetical protein
MRVYTSVHAKGMQEPTRPAHHTYEYLKTAITMHVRIHLHIVLLYIYMYI